MQSRVIPICLIMLLTAVGSASGQSVSVTSNTNTTEFRLNIPTDSALTSAHLVIRDERGKRVHDEWVTLSDDSDSSLEEKPIFTLTGSTTYNWECAHIGPLKWRVTSSSAIPLVDESGQFRVKGRCYETFGKPILRATARSYMLSDLVPSDQSSYYAKCKPRSQAHKGRAIRWACGAVWTDGTRSCSTVWLIRSRQRVEFREVTAEFLDNRRVRRFVCT